MTGKLEIGVLDVIRTYESSRVETIGVYTDRTYRRKDLPDNCYLATSAFGQPLYYLTDRVHEVQWLIDDRVVKTGERGLVFVGCGSVRIREG